MRKEYLDIEIIKKFQDGDQESFNEVYKAYKPYIYKLVYQFVRTEDKVNDIVQETFLRVYKNKQDLQNPEALFSWVMKIAYSVCAITYKKEKKHILNIHDFHEGFLEDQFEDKKALQVIDQIQKKEAINIILASLDEMIPDWKVTGYLRFFEELSVKEIGEIMDVPTGTVVSRLSRIKRKLKTSLEEKGFTKDSCLALLMIPSMREYYQIIDGKTQPSSSNKQPYVKAKVNWFTYPQMMFFASSIILSSGFISNKIQRENRFIGNVQHAEITTVDYDTNLTNQPLNIGVSTTNSNYDIIRINGKPELRVTKNGDYSITLEKRGKVISEKIIKVTNIDTDIPIVTHESYDGSTTTLRIADTDSAIDYSKIELYENGIKSNALRIDSTTSEIYINKEISKDHTLLVPDVLGNVLKITVNFYDFRE